MGLLNYFNNLKKNLDYKNYYDENDEYQDFEEPNELDILMDSLKEKYNNNNTSLYNRIIIIDEENGYQANKIAMKFEKAGKIHQAITYYEKSISYNWDGTTPYWRLAVFYRKNKDFKNEIRVLNRGIDVLSHLITTPPFESGLPKKINMLNIRLMKAITLLENQRKENEIKF